MRRQWRACRDEFLATVSEGVVHGVYKVMTRSSFRVSFATVSQLLCEPRRVVEQLGISSNEYKRELDHL